MTDMVSQFHLITNSIAQREHNHEVISQNIANANTPDFKTKSVDFAAFLKQIENGSADKSLLEPVADTFVKGLPVRKDGNNVDLDQQVGALKKNALLHQTYSHILASKVAMTRRAMNG